MLGNGGRIGICAIAALAACNGDATPSDPCARSESIKIGTLHSLTGSLGSSGPPIDEAADMAAKEINDQGGVLGRPICVLHRDDATDADLARTRAAKLVDEDGVVAILGGSSSGTSFSILEKTIPANVLQISCCATSPALSQVDNFFRTAPSDALQGVVLARKAKMKGYAKISIIYVTGPYGEGLANAFTANFADATHMVVSSGAYVEQQPTYADVVEPALAPMPDAILLIGYPSDAVTIVNDTRNARMGIPIAWMFAESIKYPAFLNNLGTAKDYIEGAIGTAPVASTADQDRARFQTFFSAYKAFTGWSDNIPPLFAEHTYDALYLVAAAIEASATADRGPAIARVLDVSKSGTAFGPGEWTRAKNAIQMGSDVDYQGASGPVDLDQFGEPSGVYEIWTVMQGEFRTLGVEEP